MDQPRRLHILTGEFPPTPGGVGDYSFLVSRGLARRGVEVHVWTSGREASATEEDGVIVHRRVASWARRGLSALGEAIDRTPGPRELLVEYVPQNFGCRGLNVWFGPWLQARARRGDRVRTMFHELAYQASWAERPRFWLMHYLTRMMARDILKASHRVDVSIPAWEGRIRRLAPSFARPVCWMPVPSNVPVVNDPPAEAAVRSRVGAPGTTIVGTFGTYSEWMRGRLESALPKLLEGKPGRAALILGRGSGEFAAEMVRRDPGLEGRVTATGELESRPLSAHLMACDLLVQPYPDGVSSRRGTTMAGISHGRPVATTRGLLTEPLWAESGAVALATVDDVGALARVAEGLLADPSARESLGRAARALYDERFTVEETVRLLMADRPERRTAEAEASDLTRSIP